MIINNGEIKRTYSDINNPLIGYILYERDLDKDCLVESLNSLFNLNDVFKFNLNNPRESNSNIPNIFEIHCLDEIELNKKINEYIDFDSNLNKNVIDVRLIFFNNNLRGYFFKCSSELFDERSLTNILVSVEEHYFKGKLNQANISYKTWFESSNSTFVKIVEPEDNATDIIKTNFNDSDIRLIKEYIKKENLDINQFFLNVISYSYNIAMKGEQFVFETDVFDQVNSSTIGKIISEIYYFLSYDRNIELKDIFKQKTIETNLNSGIYISKPEVNKNILGKVKRFKSKESKYSIEFIIKENRMDLDLEVVYKKSKFNSTDIDLIISIIVKTIYSTLNKKIIPEEFVISNNDKDILYKFTEPSRKINLKRIYDLFISRRIKNSSGIGLIEDKKSYTYLDISKALIKIEKKLKKFGIREGTKIDFEFSNVFDTLAAILAIDSLNCTYSPKDASYVIKNNILGYSVTKLNDIDLEKSLQYKVGDISLSKVNFRLYCDWYFEYFNLTNSDRFLISSNSNTIDFFLEAIPAFLSGATLIFSKKNVPIIEQLNVDKITVAYLKLHDLDNLNDDHHLKHVIIKNEVVDFRKQNFKIHVGVSLDDNSPFIFMNTLKENDNSIGEPLPSTGVLVLNSKQMLSSVCEEGDLYVFGSFLNNSSSQFTRLSVNGRMFDNIMKTNLKTMWSLEGKLLRCR